MKGYHGRYLRVDLTHRAAALVELPEPVLRRFLGGVGLGTWLLNRESCPGVDPLAPEAPLVFALSPLVGTPVTTSAKFAVVSKSPLTDRLNDSLSSSHFALAGKRAGVDALVIVGRCEAESFLLVEDGRVEVRPARQLWGLSAGDAENELRGLLGPAFEFAVIGPAGERQVRFATISHAARHAGRGGHGAVLGSKRLKAVAVGGSQRVAVADAAAVAEAAKDLSARSFGPATAKYRELGTVSNLLTFNRLGVLPARNFQQGTFEGADRLSGEELTAARHLARRSCAACTIGCEHIFDSGRGGVRLEYETLFALGPLCGVSDPDVVIGAARRCDELGLDTISTGGTIAFAMECVERGLLDVPGLRFGEARGLLDTIGLIARREGVGDWLAEGSRRLAERIGGDALNFAPHVKGLELPGYDPRGLQTLALGLAVGSRGADHNRSGAYEVDFSARADRLRGSANSALLAAETEDRAALLDSLILCKFLRGVFDDLFAESAQLLARVTGWDVTAEELRATARRIVTAKKLFNVREGWTPAEDTLPDRLLTGGDEGGLPRARLQEMVRAYYAARGWREDGSVPPEVVAALDLAEFVPGRG
jgi:aldehyde:ferredoxin oxidoreductase